MSNTQHDKQHKHPNMLNTQHDKQHNIQICQIHNMTSRITSKYVKYTT